VALTRGQGVQALGVDQLPVIEQALMTQAVRKGGSTVSAMMKIKCEL
jgi:hypothetical protein